MKSLGSVLPRLLAPALTAAMILGTGLVGTAEASGAAAGGPVPRLGRSLPVKIEIRKLHVRKKVVRLGRTRHGAIKAPSIRRVNDVAWYKRSATPGERGSAVFTAHVDTYRGPAVFYRLKDLRKGDRVVVTRKDGLRVTYAVEKVRLFRKDRFPARKVLGPTKRPTLRLITCGGAFSVSRRSYTHNVIAFAHAVRVGKKHVAKKHHRKHARHRKNRG